MAEQHGVPEQAAAGKSHGGLGGSYKVLGGRGGPGHPHPAGLRAQGQRGWWRAVCGSQLAPTVQRSPLGGALHCASGFTKKEISQQGKHRKAQNGVLVSSCPEATGCPRPLSLDVPLGEDSFHQP